MPDYTIFYKGKIAPQEAWPEKWDLLLSAYNDSERVQMVFKHAPATEKHWLIHPEYGYTPSEYPPGCVFVPPLGDEAEFWSFYFDNLGVSLSGARVCVDSTGFMRPHLMLLLQFLPRAGVPTFDVLYSEPGQYKKQEKTNFSLPPVVDVRPVLGFEGSHTTDTSRDLLIIGSGYDYPLISHAAEHKKSARKVQLLGFPSLRPDMFQENVLMAHRAAESLGERGLDGRRDFFAPANDPFVVASVVQQIVAQAESKMPITNLYLCPLATKPQALGFALYHLSERVGTATSVIFPYARSYTRETSAGISRVWRYSFELSTGA
jgi:hypothetical protein